MIGYARFGGGEPLDGSYVDINMDPNPAEPDKYDSLGVTMWVRPTNLNNGVQTLLDCNIAGIMAGPRFLKMDLISTGQLEVSLNAGGKTTFKSLEKFPVVAGEWNLVGFTFDGASGTFFVGEQFGYNDGTNGDKFWSYFTIDPANTWPQDAFSERSKNKIIFYLISDCFNTRKFGL